jgi:hypothetical protein
LPVSSRRLKRGPGTNVGFPGGLLR